MSEIRATKMTDLEVTKAHAVASLELLEVEEAVRELLRSTPAEEDAREMDEKKKLQLAIGSIDRLCERIENMEVGLETTIQEHAKLVEKLRIKRKTLRELFTTWTGGPDGLETEINKLKEATDAGDLDEDAARERRLMLEQLKKLQEQKLDIQETGPELQRVSAEMSTVVIDLYESEADNLRKSLATATPEQAVEIKKKLEDIEERIATEKENQKEILLEEAALKEITEDKRVVRPQTRLAQIEEVEEPTSSPEEKQKMEEERGEKEEREEREEEEEGEEEEEEVEGEYKEEEVEVEEREQIPEWERGEASEASMPVIEDESSISTFSASISDEELATLGDFEYLKNTVGKPLVDALVQCCLHQPQDTIDYVAGYLLFYRKNCEKQIQRKQLNDKLLAQRQIIAASFAKVEELPPSLPNTQEEEGYMDILENDPFLMGPRY